MATGEREKFIAGLLNTNVLNADKNNLLEVIADYFTERELSYCESDESG